MRILYIHQYFATRESTSGTRSYEFARRLVEKGFQVSVLTGGNTGEKLLGRPVENVEETTVDGIRIIIVGVRYDRTASPPKKALSFLRFMWRAAKVALKENTDLIFATSTPLTVAFPALAKKIFQRTPYVFEVRDLWPEVPIRIGILRNPIIIGLARWLEKKAYKHAFHIVALSEGMRDGIIARGIPAEKVTVIPNCADLDLFGPQAPPDPQLAARLQGKFVCIHSGAMGRINGLDHVIDTAIWLKEHAAKEQATEPKERAANERAANDIAFLLIGVGSERPRLQERARSAGLDNVIFMDPVPKQQLPGVINACQVCLMSVAPIPVLEMNSANKFFDYLASAKPVIINYGGWMKHVLENAGAGLSVAYDAEALATALMALKDDPERCAQMGANARKLAEREYDRALMVDRIEMVLRSALKSDAKS